MNKHEDNKFEVERPDGGKFMTKIQKLLDFRDRKDINRPQKVSK